VRIAINARAVCTPKDAGVGAGRTRWGLKTALAAEEIGRGWILCWLFRAGRRGA
jgi:hypothetical protein